MESPGRRYEKDRPEEYVENRRDRRASPGGVRSRESDRKDAHRHREYDKYV